MSNDGTQTDAEKRLDEALKRIRVEAVSAVGDIVKALTPVFSEAGKIAKALADIAREAKESKK